MNANGLAIAEHIDIGGHHIENEILCGTVELRISGLNAGAGLIDPSINAPARIHGYRRLQLRRCDRAIANVEGRRLCTVERFITSGRGEIDRWRTRPTGLVQLLPGHPDLGALRFKRRIGLEGQIQRFGQSFRNDRLRQRHYGQGD